MFTSIESLQKLLLEHNYVADRGLATVIYLSAKLGKPLFLEGEAGVGKTEVAKVLAKILKAKLIRLQCYEGLDVHNAVYEWAYARQIMHLRILDAQGADIEKMEGDLYSREFLLQRPLLEAIEFPGEQWKTLGVTRPSANPSPTSCCPRLGYRVRADRVRSDGSRWAAPHPSFDVATAWPAISRLLRAF